MADPTPEEVAIHNALLSLFCWIDTRDDKPAESKIFINARETVNCCIRAAVAAETERIKRLCPWCHGKGSVGRLDEVEECETCSWIIAAAIRRGREPDDAEAKN